MSGEPERVVGANSVGVWLAVVPADTDHLLPQVDAIERCRHERLRRPDDRRRFLAAAVLLRRVAVAQLGDDVVIDRTCDTCGQPHGRPSLRAGRLGVAAPHDVSVTHAGGYVAVAYSPVARVGVDIEVVAPDRAAVVDLLDVACAPDERAAIRTPRDFAIVWTRKEAVLKATGTGLRRSPAEVVVSSPAAGPELLALGTGPAPSCRMVDLDLDDRHAGAIAVLTDDEPTIVVHDGAALLGA